MPRTQAKRGRAVLEAVLAAAILALIAQLILPYVTVKSMIRLDVRYWPRWVWFLLNMAGVLMMLSVRFGPDLKAEWNERRNANISKAAKAAKSKEQQEHREQIERLKRGRKSRMW